MKKKNLINYQKKKKKKKKKGNEKGVIRKENCIQVY